MKNIYIVKEYYNDYDQHDGYFVSAHSTRESAQKSIPWEGRRDFEYSWYEITEEEIHNE